MPNEATAPPEANLLDGCTSEMRRGLLQLRSGPKFLGPQAPAVPRGTATALRRRGLIEDDEGGSRVQLTHLGRRVAALARQRSLLTLPPGDGEVRMTAIVHANVDDRFAPGCLDGELGETVQLRKHVGGSLTGRLVAYDLVGDGSAVKVTLDLPAGDDLKVKTRWSLPAKP